ncbi:sorbosone dehydrogenase family protein [Natronomonas sp. CBA1123]|uniref:PQQ-dependent sugar dehydrogenase n=1 Tax=Natronomonas sp. CBA1123 TaxID=2668070 RepID=UPI001E47E72D|nr:PQQ-dependent sugar dehydrogenase [Natronomonas sp. CBA1123]
MYNSGPNGEENEIQSEHGRLGGLTRRRLLAATAASATMAGLAGCSFQRGGGEPGNTPASTPNTNPTPTSDTPEPEPYFEPGPTVGVETVAEGLVLPNVLAVAPDDDRLFIADQTGVVYVHEDGSLHEEPFLDVRDRVIELGSDLPSWVATDERGFLGFAFHPDFADNGLFYVRYSAPTDEDGIDHREILSEFSATDGTADPDSERILLDLPWQRPIHQAGTLAFGPDGYLYAAFGDGLNPSHGQNFLDNFRGSILRLDVDERDGEKPYGIPSDNPLVGREGRDEYFAWGFRNPWKMAFDGETLIVGDVGQELFEEINVVERGGNYGWPIKEGSSCHDPAQPGIPPADCPDTSERGEPLVDPVVEFPHFDGDRAVGFAVIGGHVYRGDAVPQLDGEYLFGIYTRSFTAPSGRIVAATPEGDSWPTRELQFAGSENGEVNLNVISIGQDNDGEVYVLGTTAAVSEGMESQQGGTVYRIVDAE